MDIDPLEWWKTHEHQYSRLSIFAKCIFGIPLSECECERVFSAAGIIKNRLRNKLNSQNLNNLLIISQNQCFLTQIPQSINNKRSIDNITPDINEYEMEDVIYISGVSHPNRFAYNDNNNNNNTNSNNNNNNNNYLNASDIYEDYITLDNDEYQELDNMSSDDEKEQEEKDKQ